MNAVWFFSGFVLGLSVLVIISATLRSWLDDANQAYDDALTLNFYTWELQQEICGKEKT